MVDLASCNPELFQGLPCRRLVLPNGDSVLVALHGAQVLSWVVAGRERLYLSPRSPMDGKAAIRGGVPVCFPQFNQRGPLPKHGFARNLPWVVDELTHVEEQDAQLMLRLSASAATRAFWAEAFDAMLTVRLEPGCLQITLDVHNTGDRPLSFTGALHTYLAVNDIAAVQLEGLLGQAQWDAVTDQQGHAPGALRFEGEFDRVYCAAAKALTLHDGAVCVRIDQSPSFADTVVWNPGAAKCASLPDMPADGFARMLCVEAAQVMQPALVQAGAHWQGWQRLSVQ